MKNIAVYVLLIVIGGVIGASALYFLIPNQTPIMTEQEVKVTIQSITYDETEYAVLEIELLNDAPEKDLDGTVGIYQGNKQWTSEVTWYYTGYGEATILCDTINENQSFRITYNEKNPQATYLDRTIEWYEVELPDMTSGFMETKELRVTDIAFNEGNTNATLSITNSGKGKVTIAIIKVNGATVVNSATDPDLLTDSSTLQYEAGASNTLTMNLAWTAGNKYKVSLFTSDGTLVGSFQDTA